MVWWIRVGLEDGKEKEGYRDGMPEEKEADEMALGAPERSRKGGGMANKVPRTPIKVGDS